MPSRSRAEAIALATRIAKEAQEDPDPARFASLAKQFSDDAPTASWGGSLGTIPASRLPREYLDAIAALKAGQTSVPIETDFGIPVIRLEATPPESRVLASRIVVAYRTAGTAALRPGRPRDRTRADALDLANRMVEQARAPGADFDQLVEKYSDNVDVNQHGDIGVWSTHHPVNRGPLIEALLAVPIGGVTEPVDSLEGFQILKRRTLEEREIFSATYVYVGYLAPEQRAGAESTARELVEILRKQPDRFPKLQSKFCCNGVQTWRRGRGPGAAVEAFLRTLAPDELGLGAVETPFGFYLVRRLSPMGDPESVPVQTTLPEPPEPNLSRLVEYVVPTALAKSLSAISDTLPRTLRLPEQKAKHVQSLLSGLSSELTYLPPAKRGAAVDGFWAKLEHELSPADVQAFRRFVMDHVKQRLMSE